MHLKLESFISNSAWELVELPQRKTTIGYKWVFKMKLKVDRTLNKYKAQLVAKDLLFFFCKWFVPQLEFF